MRRRVSRLLPFLILGCGGRFDTGSNIDPNDDPAQSPPMDSDASILDGGAADTIVADTGTSDAGCEKPKCVWEGDASTAIIPVACSRVWTAPKSCEELCAAICFKPWQCSLDGPRLACWLPPQGPGRRPEGYAPDEATPSGFFDRSAELEAASVIAFEILARELESYGAPQRLVREALRSAEDEKRHARAMQILALRYGETGAIRLRVHEPRERTLFAIALENAIEGCVTETFAAILAAWQSIHADAPIARAMHSIARDEGRHADLSWDVHAWAMPRLTVDQQRQIRNAMADAIATIERTAFEVRDARIGLPDKNEVRVLASRLRERLWDVELAA